MIREPGFSINRKDIFERLFSDYYGILVCYAQKYTKREDIAEDIVQDVFASLWEENRIFPSQANFRSFLYISIRNAAFDYLRHQNVESRYIEDLFLLFFCNSYPIIRYRQNKFRFFFL